MFWKLHHMAIELNYTTVSVQLLLPYPTLM
jgi:hypothetical protein